MPRWELVKSAEAAFAPHLSHYPVLQNIIDAWRQGGSVRQTKPCSESIQDWLDAIKVVDACKERINRNLPDTPIRRLSASIFFDSKRIELISSLIDVLTQEKINGLQRDPEEFFQEIGLVKFPSTILLAVGPKDSNHVRVCLDDIALTITSPYLGFPPDAITSFDITQRPITLLTIENLTTFHEVAELIQSRSVSKQPLLVIYTAGMPSPSWRAVYGKVIKNLTNGSNIFHWGDIDAGGFRIANKLAEDCIENGKTLQLHQMNVSSKIGRKLLSDTEINSINWICNRHNWVSEAEFINIHRAAIEQESLPIILPDS